MSDRQRRLQQWLVGSTIAFTAVVGGVIAYASVARGNPSPDPRTLNAPYPQDGRVGAATQVLVFSDLKCTHCARLHEELKGALADAVNRGDVTVAYLAAPILGPDSTGGAAGAQCAYVIGGQRAFGTYVDEIYQEQKRHRMSERWLTPEIINAAGSAAGLNIPAFERCVTSDRTRKAVREQAQLFPQAAVVGTPGVFVNGRHVQSTAQAILEAAAQGDMQRGLSGH